MKFAQGTLDARTRRRAPFIVATTVLLAIAAGGATFERQLMPLPGSNCFHTLGLPILDGNPSEDELKQFLKAQQEQDRKMGPGCVRDTFVYADDTGTHEYSRKHSIRDFNANR